MRRTSFGICAGLHGMAGATHRTTITSGRSQHIVLPSVRRRLNGVLVVVLMIALAAQGLISIPLPGGNFITTNSSSVRHGRHGHERPGINFGAN
jgi:hypothetical protein